MTLYYALWLVGRVLFGGFFLYNAYGHFKNLEGMTGYAASKGVPNPKLAIIGSGVLLVLGGLSVLLNYQMMYGLWALVIFLIPVTLMMHAFWKETDPAAKAGAKIQFSKNMAILGACLLLMY